MSGPPDRRAPPEQWPQLPWLDVGWSCPAGRLMIYYSRRTWTAGPHRPNDRRHGRPVTPRGGRKTGEHLTLERLGAVRADGHVAQPGWWAVPHTHLHAQLQAVRA